MLVVPLLDTPAQVFNVLLANQFCRLNLYQKSTGFFMDLYVQDALIAGGAVCEDRNRIVRDTHLGFQGNLVFTDTQGYTDPVPPGLGTRYLLYYLTADELLAAGALVQ